MAPRSSKKLVIIRHAHRDKTLGHAVDNGISAKGKKQAAKATKHFLKVYGGEKPLILSSPKKRCLETVEGIAGETGTEVRIEKMLDEQSERPPETAAAFGKRLAKFLAWWKEEAPPLTVICSHGDWIPAFLAASTGAHAELSKGGWAELELDHDEVSLTWLIQEYAF